LIDKIAVCTAWGSPFAWTHAAYNMMNLIRPDGVDVRFYPGWGWCPARRHMYGVELALEWGATHICFLGADQVHELDILLKFTKHIKDGWRIVTALVPVRTRMDKNKKPFQPMVFKEKDGDFKPINPSDAPYQEVDTVGTGALMFDAKLLLTLQKPWFAETIIDNSYNREATMDTRFVHRLTQIAKSKILCDCTIGVKHLDIFPIDPSYGDRFSDWPVSSKKNSKLRLREMYQPE
jgi:hypothetical protein